MSAELTARLDAIQARATEATPGPWKPDTGVRGDCVVWGPNGRFLMNMQAEPHWIEYPGEKRSVSFDVDARDARFIAAAREDVPFLLDLARKQQAALDAVRELHVAEGNGNCITCWDFNADSDVRWPCPTARALEANP